MNEYLAEQFIMPKNLHAFSLDRDGDALHLAALLWAWLRLRGYGMYLEVHKLCSFPSRSKIFTQG